MGFLDIWITGCLYAAICLLACCLMPYTLIYTGCLPVSIACPNGSYRSLSSAACLWFGNHSIYACWVSACCRHWVCWVTRLDLPARTTCRAIYPWVPYLAWSRSAMPGWVLPASSLGSLWVLCLYTYIWISYTAAALYNLGFWIYRSYMDIGSIYLCRSNRFLLYIYMDGLDILILIYLLCFLGFLLLLS